MAPESQLQAMAGEPGGGQLITAIKHFYLPPSQSKAVNSLFLSKRVPNFIIDMALPYPYDLEPADYMETAFDITHPIGAAGRQPVGLLDSEQARELGREKSREAGAPTTIPSYARTPSRLGPRGAEGGRCRLPRVFPGESSSKLMLAHLPALSDLLKDYFQGLIEERATAGSTSLDVIGLFIRVASLKERPAKEAATSDEVRGADEARSQETSGTPETLRNGEYPDIREVGLSIQIGIQPILETSCKSFLVR